MKVQIDSKLCQGHGRCYDLAPDLFGEDDWRVSPADLLDLRRLSLAR